MDDRDVLKLKLGGRSGSGSAGAAKTTPTAVAWRIRDLAMLCPTATFAACVTGTRSGLVVDFLYLPSSCQVRCPALIQREHCAGGKLKAGDVGQVICVEEDRIRVKVVHSGKLVW